MFVMITAFTVTFVPQRFVELTAETVKLWLSATGAATCLAIAVDDAAQPVMLNGTTIAIGVQLAFVVLLTNKDDAEVPLMPEVVLELVDPTLLDVDCFSPESNCWTETFPRRAAPTRATITMRTTDFAFLPGRTVGKPPSPVASLIS